jgi:dTMP kinase
MAPTEPLRGVFIALEGIDGSGKSTIADRLAEFVRTLGWSAVLTREPGGTPIGERVRAVILDARSEGMFPETEALLFTAARAQLVREIVWPALERGDVVISDRFADSSLAYQWGGRGLPFEAVQGMQSLAVGDIAPDLKLLFDIEPAAALRRRFAAEGALNRMDQEALAFFERVRDAYLALAADDPGPWRIIGADRPVEQVWEDVRREVVRVVEMRSTETPPIRATGSAVRS